jgi:hypothetical protein
MRRGSENIEPLELAAVLRGFEMVLGKKHLSLGGRIVLVNSVLNSIPIYYLSFMMPSYSGRKLFASKENSARVG